MKRASIFAVLGVLLFGIACGSSTSSDQTATASAPAGREEAAGQNESGPVSFTEADLEKLERGLRSEIEAVKAARAKAAAATTAQERGAAGQAEWDTATIPLGAKASGLSEARYRDVRGVVDRVFTTLDF